MKCWAYNFLSPHITFGRCGRSNGAFWAPKNSNYFKSGQICRVDWNWSDANFCINDFPCAILSFWDMIDFGLFFFAGEKIWRIFFISGFNPPHSGGDRIFFYAFSNTKLLIVISRFSITENRTKKKSGQFQSTLQIWPLMKKFEFLGVIWCDTEFNAHHFFSTLRIPYVKMVTSEGGRCAKP